MRSPRTATIKCPERKARLVMPTSRAFLFAPRRRESERSDLRRTVPAASRRRGRAHRPPAGGPRRSASSCSTAPPARRSRASTLTADDFGGPELEGCNENLCATRPDVVDGVHEGYLAAGCDIVETNSFGGTPLVLGEYGLADHAFELNRLAAAHRPRRLRPPFDAREAPLRLRLHGADHQGDLGDRRHHLRGADRELPRPGARPHGRRRRLPAAGDRAGHAQHQGRPDRHRAGLRAGRLEDSGRRLGDHRDHRHHARRPGRRGARRLPAARRPSLRGPQLRHRPRADDRPRPHALRDLPHARRLRPQRRPAQRGRLLHRGAGRLRARLRPLPRRRLAQPGRRLLRHQRRPHRQRLARLVAGAEAATPSRITGAPWSPASRRSSSPRRQRPVLVGERTNVLGSRKFKTADPGRAARGRRRGGRAPRSRPAARSSTSACQDPDRDEIGDVEALPRPRSSAWSRCR